LLSACPLRPGLLPPVSLHSPAPCLRPGSTLTKCSSSRPRATLSGLISLRWKHSWRHLALLGSAAQADAVDSTFRTSPKPSSNICGRYGCRACGCEAGCGGQEMLLKAQCTRQQRRYLKLLLLRCPP
jgi:hypothetical protein